MMKSLAEVAGTHVRAFRLDAGKSLEALATAVNSFGLRWSTGSAGDFEAGRAAMNIWTLIAVATALCDITGRPVTLGDLFAGDDSVQITDRLAVPLSVVRGVLAGQPIATLGDQDIGMVTAMSLHQQTIDALAESDLRMCKNIGVDPIVAAAAMARLWGRTFVAERDRRAGLDASPQRRGHISRQLKSELIDLVG